MKSERTFELQRGAPADGAKAARGVGDRRAGQLPDGPAADALQDTLRDAEVLEPRRIAVADHHVGVAAQDRLHERLDVTRVVLVVGVGVDDDVGAALERVIEAGGEGAREPLMIREADDLVDAVGERDLGGRVACYRRR